MTLDDLPQYKEAVEKFHAAGAELVELITTYQGHGITLLPLGVTAHVVAAVDGAKKLLDEG